MDHPKCPKCNKPLTFLIQPVAIHIGKRCFLTPLGGICLPCYTADLEQQHGKQEKKTGKIKAPKATGGPGWLAKLFKREKK